MLAGKACWLNGCLGLANTAACVCPHMQEAVCWGGPSALSPVVGTGQVLATHNVSNHSMPRVHTTVCSLHAVLH